MNKFKGFFSIGFADILGNGLTSFFWFYLASLLSPEAYGEIHFFLGIAGVAAYSSLVGTQNTIIVYKAKNVKLQSTLYFISLLIGIIASFTIIVLFYRIDVIFVLFGYIINTLAIGDLLGRKAFGEYTKFVLIQKGLTLVLGLGFYYIFGVEGILYALAITYIFYSKIIYKGLKDSKLDFNLLKTKIGFVANNYSMILASGFYGQVDKLIIAPLLGFALLGNYSLALQATSAMMIISQIFFKYSLPQDSTGNNNPKLKKITVLISIFIATLGIILAPILIPYFFPEYLDAIQAIQIMSLQVIPATIVLIYVSKLLGIEKTKIVLIARIISLIITIFGFIILGPIYGILGLAVIVVVSSTVQASILIISSKKQVKYNEE